MADYDEDDDEYFAEITSEEELTGLEPKFARIPPLDLPPADVAAMTVEDLVRVYIEARNQLATDRKGYKTREARVKTFLEIVSMTMRDKGDTMGVDSFKTKAGTAYRNRKEKFLISDWDAVTRYIDETKNYHVLQKRVSPVAVKEIREQDGLLVPGLEPLVEVEFAVRSPVAKK